MLIHLSLSGLYFPDQILSTSAYPLPGGSIIVRLPPIPPGNAVKPLSLVAPIFGLAQWFVPDSFIFPPAIESPPRKALNCSTSII